MRNLPKPAEASAGTSRLRGVRARGLKPALALSQMGQNTKHKTAYIENEGAQHKKWRCVSLRRHHVVHHASQRIRDSRLFLHREDEWLWSAPRCRVALQLHCPLDSDECTHWDVRCVLQQAVDPSMLDPLSHKAIPLGLDDDPAFVERLASVRHAVHQPLRLAYDRSQPVPAFGIPLVFSNTNGPARTIL